MKANFKNLSVKDYLFVLLFFITVGFIMDDFCQRYKKEDAQNKLADKEQFITKMSLIVAAAPPKKPDEIKPSNIEESKKILRAQLVDYSKKLDTIARQTGIKKKEVSEPSVITQLITDTEKTVTRIVTKPIYAYHDNTFGYTFQLNGDSIPVVSVTSAKIPVQFINYQKKTRRIIGSLRSYADFYSEDARVILYNKKAISLPGAQKVTFLQQEPSFGLRIRGAATYNTYTSGFFLGPELAFDFGKNQIRTNGYFNTLTGKFTPTFTFTRDFVRF